MNSTTKTIGKIGFLAGFTSFSATLLFVAVQLLQVVGLLQFPYDEILIYGSSLCIVIPFILEMLAFHYLTQPEKQYWTHLSLIFTTIYAILVTSNYVVQLATVIPSKLSGSLNTIQLLVQSPHSLFWNYDAIGYIAMGLATMFAIPALDRKGFEGWVRLSFFANALVTPLIAIVYFHPRFSNTLFLLGFPWAISAPLSMLLLAIMLRRRGT